VAEVDGLHSLGEEGLLQEDQVDQVEETRWEEAGHIQQEVVLALGQEDDSQQEDLDLEDRSRLEEEDPGLGDHKRLGVEALGLAGRILRVVADLDQEDNLGVVAERTLLAVADDYLAWDPRWVEVVEDVAVGEGDQRLDLRLVADLVVERL